MPAPEFRSARERTSQELAALFTRGYEGYLTPVSIGADEFENMVATNDLDLGASRIACENGQAVAFALLGVRGTRGWVGGMGVIPEARGRSLGRLAMESVIASAREHGVSELDLEVLEHNTYAARIYETLGFRDRRWLDVWVRKPGALAAAPATPGAAPEAVVELGLEECLEAHRRCHSARPPWQRDLESLRNWGTRLSAVGLRGARGVRGWVIYREAANRLNLADLAAAPGESVRPIGAALAALIGARPSATTMLVNLPADDAFASVLRELGATVELRQREMTLAL